MIRNLLLKIWRLLPVRIQMVLSRLVNPLFQVFVAAVIINDEEEVLLVKSTYQRFHPWGLPGGSLEYGESSEDAVIREVLEETSLKVTVEKLLLVKTWRPDRVGMYYLCRREFGEFQPSDEVAEAGYFPMNDLPDVRPVDVELMRQICTTIETV